MDFFLPFNSIYATFFGTSPPARACVAADLPPSMRVKFDCFAYAETSSTQRIALHVQGLSYWAPANIGPYSQAVLVDENMFVSGQIGLIPASLSLPSPQDPATETALVFQHTERVVDAVRKLSGRWKGHTQLAIYWLVGRVQAAGVAAACELSAIVSTILSTSFVRSHSTPGEEHAYDIIGNIFSTQGCHNRKAGSPAHRALHRQRRGGGCRRAYFPSRQAAARSSRTKLTSNVASVQDGENLLYYEVSSMEGSGNTHAIVCVSGSGELYRHFALDVHAENFPASMQSLEGCPGLASLEKNASSIRLFHLPSISASECKYVVSDSVRFLVNLMNQPQP
jgi:enamine deaminase RidA (YjgF/YER057c/UK114 family)